MCRDCKLPFVWYKDIPRPMCSIQCRKPGVLNTTVTVCRDDAQELIDARCEEEALSLLKGEDKPTVGRSVVKKKTAEYAYEYSVTEHNFASSIADVFREFTIVVRTPNNFNLMAICQSCKRYAQHRVLVPKFATYIPKEACNLCRYRENPFNLGACSLSHING